MAIKVGSLLEPNSDQTHQIKRQPSNPFDLYPEPDALHGSQPPHDMYMDSRLNDQVQVAEYNECDPMLHSSNMHYDSLNVNAKPPPGSGSKSKLGFSAMLLQSNMASNISTSFNIIKGIMGVGILTMPWSISNVGLLPSVILILLSFVLSYICWILLCYLCQHYNVYAYRDIGFVLFGHKFANFLDVVLLVFLYLVCILYIVFLSEFAMDGLSEFGIPIDDSITFSNLYTIASLSQFVKTKFFIITASVFVILFPLSLLPRLDMLKYSSFLGIIGCFYTIGLVAFVFFDNKDQTGVYVAKSVDFWGNFHHPHNSASTESSNGRWYGWYWLSSFSVFVACFNTHFNCPALYGELKHKTPSKYIKISSISFILVLVINFIIGLCGYFAFGTDCDENILDTLNHGLIVGVARFIMTLTIIGTYPLLFWNIKISINHLLLYKSVTNPTHTRIKKVRRKYTCGCSKFFVYLLVTATIWVAAVVAKDVAVLITFMQSLLGNAIVFILPSVFYLQMLKQDANKMGTRNKRSVTKILMITILCYIIVAFGLLCVLGGCIASIMFWTGYIQ
mmetsp:Transcript_27804/g.45857  ORF Transcript_27804/g.45857 Transcript_27804/m.45857 type:complete len:562 (+) Transcript_27804:22-1707(+)